jgi:hypothetical protein
MEMNHQPHSVPPLPRTPVPSHTPSSSSSSPYFPSSSSQSAHHDDVRQHRLASNKSTDDRKTDTPHSEAKKTGLAKFFSGISWVQILSGGLAAVIVFLLSMRLGFAGTIVGAALASMISTFSSQLFQNILQESEKKIKKVAKKEVPSALPSALGGSSSEQTSTLRMGSQPPLPSAHSHDGDTSVLPPTSLTPPLPGTQSGAQTHAQTSRSRQQTAKSSVLSRSASAMRHRRMVILSLVTTLLSVALVAGGILLLTHGKGTGPVVPSTRVEQNDDSKRTEQRTQPTPKPSQNSGSTSTDNSQNEGTTNGSGSQPSQSHSNSQQNQNSGSTSQNNTNSPSSGSNSSTDSNKTDNGSNSSNSTTSNGNNSSSDSTGSSDSDQKDRDKDKNSEDSSNSSSDKSSNQSDTSSNQTSGQSVSK